MKYDLYHEFPQQKAQKQQGRQKWGDSLQRLLILLLIVLAFGSGVFWLYVLPLMAFVGQTNRLLQYLTARRISGVAQSDTENLFRLGYDRETTIQIVLAGIATTQPKSEIDHQLADLQSRIDEAPPDRVFILPEKRTAYLLSHEGKHVVAVAATNTSRSGDALVNGVLTEFKALGPGATSNTVVGRVKDSITAGGQARNLLLNTRGSGLPLSEAKRSFSRLKGNNNTKGRVDSIRIIGDDFDIMEIEFP